MYFSSIYCELQREHKMERVKCIFLLGVWTENLLSTGVITYDLIQEALLAQDQRAYLVCCAFTDMFYIWKLLVSKYI